MTRASLPIIEFTDGDGSCLYVALRVQTVSVEFDQFGWGSVWFLTTGKNSKG
jgi:hypothetical protein